MLSATTLKDEETFAFDPASNLLDPKAPRRPIHHPPPKLLDNLLRDYLGQHYTYDARGNLLERLDNGKKARFTWDLYDRLTRYEDDRLTADFAYDALGRRVAKYSKAHCPPSPGAGPAWIEQQQRRSTPNTTAAKTSTAGTANWSMKAATAKPLCDNAKKRCFPL
ncbi:UNVERIFIED_ORG: YD repeat-containing protein [Pseudomonas psychrophila]